MTGFHGNTSCFYAVFYFASLVSDPHSIRGFAPTMAATATRCRNAGKACAGTTAFCPRLLIRELGPQDAEDKQVYDLCPLLHHMASYRQPMVPRGCEMPYYTSLSPASLW